MTRLRLVFTLSTLPILAAAQTAEQQGIFRGGVEGVVIPVAVDRDGKPVRDLKKADFELRDNGVIQSLVDVTVDTLPLDITVLIDASASMEFPGGIAPAVKAGVSKIQDGLRQGDRLRLVKFAMRAEMVEMPIDLVPSRDLQNRRTRLLDTLVLAVVGAPAQESRRVVIAITDGLDNASVPNDSLRSALLDRSDATVFIVAMEQRLREFGFHMWDNWRLRDVVTRTGGSLFEVNTSDNFVSSLDRSIETLRSSYLIRYVPAGVNMDGWHKIDVNVTRPGSYAVKCRRGYFAGTPTSH